MPQSLHVSYERNTLDGKNHCSYVYDYTAILVKEKTKIQLFENKNHNQTYIPTRVSQFIKSTVLQSKKR